MNSLDLLKIAALGLAGVFAWGLFCIAIWGAPKTGKRQAEELAEQAEALKARQIKREDEWITELEGLIEGQSGNLRVLRNHPPTVANLSARGMAVISIQDAEKALMTLKQRRAFGTYNQQGRA